MKKPALFLACLLLSVCGIASADISVLDAPATIELEDCDPCTFASFTLSAGSNRKVVCLLATEAGTSADNTVSATFGGSAMTLAIAAASTTAFNRVNIWYVDELDLPAPGSHSFVVDGNAPLEDLAATCLTLAGVAVETLTDAGAGSPTDTDTFSSDSAAAATLALSANATDWSFQICNHNDNTGADNSFTHGAGQTEMSDVTFAGTANTALIGTSREAGETSMTCTSSQPADRFASAGAVWPAAASTRRRFSVIHHR